MVQSINNSSSAFGLQRSLNQAQSAHEKAMERLSTGKQVNSAADNAAGLAIIERALSQIGGFNQAIRNINDGVSFTQVADSSLSSVSDDLQRIRELSVQSANGTLSDNDRVHLQKEVSQLQDEVLGRLEQTSFNGVDIFKADADIGIQAGPNANETIDINTKDLISDFAAVLAIDISTQAGAQAAFSTIDEAVEVVVDQRVGFGAVKNRLDSSASNLQNNLINTVSARSRIEDTDFARETSEKTKSGIQLQSGIALQAQANASAKLVLNLLS